MKYDVVVIGAGPAGSTSARYAAMGGAETLLVERRKDIGIPVRCGEFLPSVKELEKMLPNVSELKELFEIPGKMISRRISEICIFSPAGTRYSFPFQGFSIERRLFDRHLAVLAAREGAEILVGTEFKGIKNGEVVTSAGNYKAEVIIGADGPFSKVARSAGLSPPRELCPCVGCEVAGDFGDFLQMHFGRVAPGGYAWIIPKFETANIGLGVDRPGKGLKNLLRKFIQKVTPTSTSKIIYYTSGWVPMGGPVQRTVSGKVMIVGDAAGHVISSNGGGIPPAMICGRIAGKIAAEHVNGKKKLITYEREWRNEIGSILSSALITRKLSILPLSSDFLLEIFLFALGMTERFGEGLISRGIKGKLFDFCFKT
jgi:digeranylgeranylglycerophospholipid reductase